MARQIHTDQPANHEQRAVTAAATGSLSMNSAAVVKAVGSEVSPSSELNGDAQVTKQHSVVTESAPAFSPSDAAATGADADVVATKPSVAGTRAVETPGSVDVPGMDAVLTAGRADEDASAAALQVGNKGTLTDTLRVPSGERCGSFSSTCDDTPLSRTSNGSRCSWTLSGGATFFSSLNRHVDTQSLSFSAGAGHVSEFFQSTCSSSSTSSSSTGPSSTVGDSASSGGVAILNDCDGNVKVVSSDSSDGSRLGSSPYCSRATSNTIKSSGTSECNSTCVGSSSSSSGSSCESTRVSLDSTLVSYDNNRVSDSSGSSFEGRFTKEKPGPVKRPQQQLMEEQREAGLLQPHEELALLDFPTRVKKQERGNSIDRCIRYRGTTLNASMSPEGQGTVHDDLLLGSSSINSSPNHSSRRRSSSCSVSGKENRERSRLASSHLRLPQLYNGKEAEQRPQEKTGGGGWAGGTPEVFTESAVEREKPSESFFCNRSIAGVGGVPPRTFTAESQEKGECVFSSAAEQGAFTEELDYVNKKSCRGAEHGGWSARQRLSASVNGSPRADVPTGNDLLFRNYCSGPRLHREGAAPAREADVGVGVLRSSLSAPERHSSSRQGHGVGGENTGRGSPLFGVHRGVQQLHHANRSSISGKSVVDEAAPRSPGRPEVRTAKVSGDDRKVAGERGGATGRGGDVAEKSGSGTKESAACKREDRWTSPFPGVKYCRSRNAWIARWSESGQEKWKTFPVKDSSFEEARRRALEFRQEKDRRKFERLWQQLNAEGLTSNSSGEMRNPVLSPGGSKLSGSDSSSGEGGTARNRVAGGAAVEERNISLRKDTRSAPAWNQQQQNEESLDELPGTQRLTRLSAFRSTRLVQSAPRHQQRKQEAQQRPQLQDVMEPEGVSCETSRAELTSKGASSPNKAGGCELVDSLSNGRQWLSPGVYAETCARGGSGKDETPLSPRHFTNGWQQRSPLSTAHLQPQGAQSAFSTDSTNSLVRPEPGWLLEDPVRRDQTAAGAPTTAAAVSYREAANKSGGKTEVSALASNGPIHHQQQPYSPVNGMALTIEAAAPEGNNGLAGGRVVEALLRVLSGEDANGRKEGLCPERIALLLGDHGRARADSLARVSADDMPVSRKRRSRDEDTVYTGSESTTAESVTPTSVKILSMYKAALLLIMDDLMSNGLPLLIASGGGAPLGTDYKHLPHAHALAEGQVQLGDRKAVVEHSMRKMLEEQRRCIAEASALGAVSPFVRLFETCILDQKLPSQADDSGRTQLVYLNALSALQELSLSVKGGSSFL